MKYDMHVYMVLKLRRDIKAQGMLKMTRLIWKRISSISRSEKIVQTLNLVGGLLADKI